ncbi:MAG: putative DNA modification/repair radical SAM protein [Pseudomonadales bacterium]|nr:putative DNA modification/repair radical SAM protein [Pseudomonadales bacterium]
MEVIEKLSILADAAKYDASCASSGTQLRDSKGSSSIGSTTGMGICHSYAPDGRCISLLKILLTNLCIYDCVYCVNRHSSNVHRARFTTKEVVDLTISFYKRNYIEGLFLSSGIIQNPNYTMEQLVTVAKSLREDHGFRGYIHLKTIPDADESLIHQAGIYADRLSINIELPSTESLISLAPEKNVKSIRSSMGTLKSHIEESKEEQSSKKVSRITYVKKESKKALTKNAVRKTKRSEKLFAPAGQSTQMIVGADSSNDFKILTTSHQLYKSFGMRRVYYSAFSPIPDASKQLPLTEPPLLREHRIYQADWLMRFYGFQVSELVNTQTQPMLDLDIDPKLNWALRNRDIFPIDINRADREILLRVPGLGPRNVQRILQSRAFHRLSLEDLKRMRLSLKKIKPFISTADYHPASSLIDHENLKAKLVDPKQHQLTLF